MDSRSHTGRAILGPNESIGVSAAVYAAKRDHSVLNNGVTVDCNAPE